MIWAFLEKKKLLASAGNRIPDRLAWKLIFPFSKND
jgi:hypothetical protein